MRAKSFSIWKLFGVVATAILFSLGAALPAAFQSLPINNFTIAEGLAHNGITQIFQDKKGYLWVATGEGLSRYDGYTFKNYGNADGLSSPYVNDVTADRNGRLWVAVNDGGIARFLDERSDAVGPEKFISYSISDIPKAKNVGIIVFDLENRLWCATEGGVFRSRNIEVENNQFELVTPIGGGSVARAALIDRRGRLWFGLNDRILKIENGDLTYFDLEQSTRGFVNAIVEEAGGLFASTPSGVYGFSDAESKWLRVPVALERDQSVNTIAAGDGGSIWIGTTAGLINYRDGHQKLYTKDNGLAANSISVVYTDLENGLWLGTRGGGISHRTSSAIVNYSPQLPAKAYRVTGDGDGNTYVQMGCLPEPTRLARIIDDRVDQISFPEIRTEGCGRNHFLRTSDARWWVVTGGALRILDRPEVSGGVRVLLPDGNPVTKFLAIYEDRDANVWLSAADRNVYVSRSTAGGPPNFEMAALNIGASLILRDSRGIVWLGNNSYLGRLQDGLVSEITQGAGREQIRPRALFEDSSGRIWIGTRFDGVLYTDEPSASSPGFIKINASDGLTSNSVWAIAEDDVGGIYFGTGRGLVRYERATGLLRHFTSADGIPESAVNHIFKDNQGLIWVASDGGVLRIDPRALDQGARPPSVFISRVLVEGRELPLPETGVTEYASDELSADQNSVSVQFVGLNLKGARSLNYQYMLEGYDADWSPPTRQREVNFANLAAGTYRLLVKAIDQRGVESENPAVLQFQIMPPFWQRWWFLTLAAVGIAMGLYALYRFKMTRVIELERVRTRIATDLHDDIGSNLTRIALMSEVLNQQASGNGSASKMLPSIANIARESVASMNDIVWAISPEHDRVLDLTRRMRQHAEEVFTFRDIEVAFASGSSDSERKLMVGVRRDVLLVFKEAVNNAARHSSCTKVKIDFTCTSSRLSLRIADNGDGFSGRSDADGHGLASMHRRAASLGGKLDIQSVEGGGTTVCLDVPL